MTGDEPDHRSVTTATWTASVLMLAYGLTYHALATRLGAPASAVPIAPAALERFPAQIDDWRGEDLPMDEAIVRATGTDAHIHRRYARGNGRESVSVFVGCSAGANERVIHRPEICYARAGWTLLGQAPLELPLRDGTKLPCRIFHFQRGKLQVERATVLHYYLVDGQCSDNLSPLQSKLWRLGGSADYLARVLITAPGHISPDAATGIVSSFAVASAASIVRLFDDLQRSRATSENSASVEGK
jgi:EpsI family protein